MFGKHTFYIQNGVVDILRSTEPGSGFQDPLDTDACECLSQWAVKSQIRKGLSVCNLHHLKNVTQLLLVISDH